MLETIANTVRENLETLLVAPPIIIGALYLFVKSGNSYLQRVAEVNEERKARASQYYDQRPRTFDD